VISRIISGANSGVELAALDVARKLGIDHGGWLPKGRPRQNRELIATYGLQEIDILGKHQAMEKNIQESDGALLVFRGEKIPRLKYSVEAAFKHHRQFLGIDLRQYPAFEAASLINSWTEIQKVRTVFITGATELEVPGIYRQTQKILETVFYLSFVKSDAHKMSIREPIDLETSDRRMPPQSVQECVERLKTVLSLKERASIANMQPDELGLLRKSLGEFVKNTYGLYTGNDALMKSCAQVGQLTQPLAEEACAVILRSLWAVLRKTHKLRIVR
jgi:hypothetical protein